MTEKLLPCPFCGGEAMLEFTKERKGLGAAVACGCSANIYTVTLDTEAEAEAEAIAAWNRRVDARQLALKTKVCPMCEDCPDGCPVETPKDSINIVTNADRIRSMSDKELHKFLLDFEAGDIDYAKTFCDLCCKDAALERKSTDCEGCLLWWLKNDATLPQGIDWLKQPAETEGKK